MNPPSRHSLAGRRRRGAVMVEFIFTVPLLTLVLALTFFFGWAMAHRQRAETAGRYVAWRSVHGSSGSMGRVNDHFFRGDGRDISTNASGGPTEAQQALLWAADSVSDGAYDLAGRIVPGAPGGTRRRVSALLDPGVGMWRPLVRGPMHAHHAREGVEWRRGQLRCEQSVAEAFIWPLDDVLADLASTPAEDIAESFRRLYLRRW